MCWEGFEIRSNILAVAKEAGYEITEEEAAAYAEALPENDELTNFELEAVSGGKRDSPTVQGVKRATSGFAKFPSAFVKAHKDIEF